VKLLRSLVLIGVGWAVVEYLPGLARWLRMRSM
jgi:hypothetical protein